MTKGIRQFALSVFAADLADRAEIGNTEFRRNVVAQIVVAFDISIASASTHYNHALIKTRETNPQAVEGLGRAPDKKGGRKAKVVVVSDEAAAIVEAATTVTAVVETETATAETVTA